MDIVLECGVDQVLIAIIIHLDHPIKGAQTLLAN